MDLAQTLLLIGDWEFEWPSGRLHRRDRCISNPAVYFFGTVFKGRRLLTTFIHVFNSHGSAEGETIGHTSLSSRLADYLICLSILPVNARDGAPGHQPGNHSTFLAWPANELVPVRDTFGSGTR